MKTEEAWEKLETRALRENHNTLRVACSIERDNLTYIHHFLSWYFPLKYEILQHLLDCDISRDPDTFSYYNAIRAYAYTILENLHWIFEPVEFFARRLDHTASLLLPDFSARILMLGTIREYLLMLLQISCHPNQVLNDTCLEEYLMNNPSYLGSGHRRFISGIDAFSKLHENRFSLSFDPMDFWRSFELRHRFTHAFRFLWWKNKHHMGPPHVYCFTKDILDVARFRGSNTQAIPLLLPVLSKMLQQDSDYEDSLWNADPEQVLTSVDLIRFLHSEIANVVNEYFQVLYLELSYKPVFFLKEESDQFMIYHCKQTAANPLPASSIFLADIFNVLYRAWKDGLIEDSQLKRYESGSIYEQELAKFEIKRRALQVQPARSLVWDLYGRSLSFVD